MSGPTVRVFSAFMHWESACMHLKLWITMDKFSIHALRWLIRAKQFARLLQKGAICAKRAASVQINPYKNLLVERCGTWSELEETTTCWQNKHNLWKEETNATWGIACQNAAYLDAICDLDLRFRAITGGRGAIQGIAPPGPHLISPHLDFSHRAKRPDSRLRNAGLLSSCTENTRNVRLSAFLGPVLGRTDF